MKPLLHPDNANCPPDCKEPGPHIHTALEADETGEVAALRAEVERLRAFVTDVLGYMERGDGRWYGEAMKDRARALLEPEGGREGGSHEVDDIGQLRGGLLRGGTG